MNISKSNFKTGLVSLRVTDPDDLWYLSHIIEPGDLVKGKTTRKLKIGGSGNAKTVKKTLTLTIEAETVELTDTSVRVNGKIKEGPEDIPKDSYHAIPIEERSDITIQKPIWLSFQKQRLKEAAQQKYNYLLLIFDREEAIFALTKKFGYEVLVKIKGDVPKKNKDVTIKKQFHDELTKALEVYNDRHNPEAIIVASPAFYKEDLLKKIKNQELQSKITLATCSDVSERSLDETLKRPELKQTLKNSRVRQEQILVEELLKEIQKNNLAAYGWKESQQAIQAGAVRSLLVTDEFIKKKREDNSYHELDEQLKQIDALQGDIHILSSDNEPGKKLNGLGGIAAILRYKI